MKVHFIIYLLIGLLFSVSVIQAASFINNNGNLIAQGDTEKSLFVVESLDDLDFLDGLQNDTSTEIVLINENLDDFCNSRSFTNYSSIIFLIDNSTILQDNQLIAIQTAVESGLTVLLQTPLLWKVDNTELLGLQPINQTIKAEWQGDIDLEILNDTYFEATSGYVGEKLSFRGRGTLAINLTDTTKTLVDVSNIEFESEGKHLGIFEHQYGLGKFFTVNVIMNRAANDRFSELLISLIQDISSYEIPSNPNPNNNNIEFFDFTIPQEFAVISVVAVAGTATVIGTRSLIATKKEEEIIGSISSGNSDFTLTALLLAPIFGILHVILEPKFRKLTIEEVYDNPTRKNILEVLQNNKFEHFRELKRLSKAGVGSLTWHLQVLIDFEIITMVKYGQFKLYILTENPPSEFDISTYFAIRNKTANKVISYFITNYQEKIKLKNLVNVIEANIDTLQYHCAKLVKLKLISLDEDGYSLNKVHKHSITVAQEHISFNSNFDSLDIF